MKNIYSYIDGEDFKLYVKITSKYLYHIHVSRTRVSALRRKREKFDPIKFYKDNLSDLQRYRQGKRKLDSFIKKMK